MAQLLVLDIEAVQLLVVQRLGDQVQRLGDVVQLLVLDVEAAQRLGVVGPGLAPPWRFPGVSLAFPWPRLGLAV